MNMRANSYSTEVYIARRRAFRQAIEACEDLIRDYKTFLTGDAHVIEGVKAAIVRIQCAEACGATLEIEK
jgi:hypothetical protein